MITLAGVTYEPIELGSYTIQYSLYMEEALEAAGITAALTALTTGSTEDERVAAAKTAWSALVASGQAPRLLAGLLKPVGAPWSVAFAGATAEALGQAGVSREDQRQMKELLLTGIASFFGVGPRS